MNAAGIFYLYAHSKIWAWKGREMSEKEFRWSLGKAWNIPKKIQPLILKEMELLGLVKREGDMVRMTHPLFNEEDCNFYYQKLKIF